MNKMADEVHVTEVARRLGVTKQRISMLVKEGRLNRSRRGYIREASLEYYLRTLTYPRPQRARLPSWPKDYKVIETLLLIGVIDPKDVRRTAPIHLLPTIMQMEEERA